MLSGNCEQMPLNAVALGFKAEPMSGGANDLDPKNLSAAHFFPLLQPPLGTQR